MNHSTSPHPLDVLTSALVSWTAASTQIVDHMASSPNQPSYSEITAILTSLIRGTLESLTERHAADDVEIGARLAADAIDTLMREILLAPHEPPPRNRAERRARRGGHR